jgi:hypothetical protein
VAWAPNSLGHTPLDFFLWGYMKVLIYSLPVDLEEDHIGHIVEAVATTRQKLHFFKHALQSLLYRRQLCIEVRGCTLDHLLKL